MYYQRKCHPYLVCNEVLNKKQACDYGTSTRATEEFETFTGAESIPAGRDEEYVEALLQRLREEGTGEA